MHRAPSINFPVTRSRWQLRFIALLSLLAMAALWAFVREQGALDARILTLATAIVASSAAAFVGWQKSAVGSLRWDGQHWYWSGFSASQACHLSLLVDFQSVLLVSLVADTRAVPLRLWLEMPPGNVSWKPLRRAIISSQAAVGGNGDRVESVPEGDTP